MAVCDTHDYAILTPKDMSYTRRMMKNGLIGLVILFVLALGLVVYMQNRELVDDHQEVVSWDEAITILNSGDVTQVTQLHNLTVTLILKDGTHIVTKEPAIDDIWDEIRECGEPCEDIVLATE